MLEKSNTLDHLVFLVDNLTQASNQFNKLGFTVTAKSVHNPLLGTANVMIMLNGHYIELLAIESPTQANQPFRDILAHFGQKLFGLAFGCESADELAKNFGKVFGKAPDVSNLDRELTLPNGEDVKAEFDVCVYPCLPPIGMAFFACQHKTPEYIWIPEQMKHQNTATAIKSVLIKVDDINSLEEAIRPCFDDQALKNDGEQLTMVMPTPISFMEAEYFCRQLGSDYLNNSDIDTIVEIKLSTHCALNSDNVEVKDAKYSDAIELVCGATLVRFLPEV